MFRTLYPLDDALTSAILSQVLERGNDPGIVKKRDHLTANPTFGLQSATCYITVLVAHAVGTQA